jgi:hypothetical protein
MVAGESWLLRRPGGDIVCAKVVGAVRCASAGSATWGSRGLRGVYLGLEIKWQVREEIGNLSQGEIELTSVHTNVEQEVKGVKRVAVGVA